MDDSDDSDDFESIDEREKYWSKYSKKTLYALVDLSKSPSFEKINDNIIDNDKKYEETERNIQSIKTENKNLKKKFNNLQLSNILNENKIQSLINKNNDMQKKK